MALTTAVAANAASAAAGAGKKAAQVALQAELNTDEEWNKFLTRDGLLVVDVYSEWCGPCLGMVGNLKKIKVELGGDNLHLAVAKADTIECLKRFRNRSEPTWMFIAGGQLLNVVFGADAPRLSRTIEEELKNEVLARKGELTRPTRAPHELTPQEQVVAEAQEKVLKERRERERVAAEEERAARRDQRARRVETHFLDVCPGLLLPHAQKHLRKLCDALEPLGVVVADKCPIMLGKECSRMLAVEEPALGAPAAAAAMTERPSLALLLKKLPDKEGDVIKLSRRALYGDELEGEEKPAKTVAEELQVDEIPGLYVPKDRQQRAAVLDLLFPKMVGSFLEPPTPPSAPHVCVMFGAWQRRAALAAATKLHARVIHYGFFADDSITEPRLLCKTLDQYEMRVEKDYCETLVLKVAVGLAEPALAEPGEVPPSGPPEELVILGPLYVSPDSVEGAEECRRFFPPGYSEPEEKPKPKMKKKKKKRHETKESSESTEVVSTEAAADAAGEEGGGEAPAEGEGEESDDGDAEGRDNGLNVDKATSPPPQTN